MGLKSKIALLITGLLAMLLFISSEVAAARNLKEGEVVRETNRVGDAKLVGGIHDVSKLSIPGIGGNFIGGVFPGNIGGGYIGGSIPIIGGGYIGGGGGFPNIGGGGGFPNIGGGFQGQAFCRFSCCVQDAMGRCLRCCSISR
ncbi:hypothetical protein JHK87_038824 [Glycine soja]|nr:hypothetical protein JHK87_038824 [Glycine soja]